MKSIDTTAAGDVFSGAIAYLLANGASIQETIKFAVIASALSTTKKGAQNTISQFDEIEAFLRYEG